MRTVNPIENSFFTALFPAALLSCILHAAGFAMLSIDLTAPPIPVGKPPAGVRAPEIVDARTYDVFTSDLTSVDIDPVLLPVSEASRSADGVRRGEFNRRRVWEDVPLSDPELAITPRVRLWEGLPSAPSAADAFVLRRESDSAGEKDGVGVVAMDFLGLAARRPVALPPKTDETAAGGSRFEPVDLWLYVSPSGEVQTAMPVVPSGVAAIDEKAVRFCRELRFEPLGERIPYALQKIAVRVRVADLPGGGLR